MKRIFIAIHYLEIGGVERSLIGLLNALDYTKYEVDLFVYEHRGEFMKLIPKEVHLLPEIKSYAAIEKPMVQALKEGQIGVVAGRLLSKLQYALYKRKHHPKEDSGLFQYVADCVNPVLPSLKHLGEYDLAISFLTPHNVVRDKVKAKRKYSWIHTDYTTISVNVKKELPVWAAFDKIFAVSEDVKKTFIQVFPSLKNKIEVFENILSPKFIREQARINDNVNANLDKRKKELSFPLSFSIEDGLRFLSVGRYTTAKNFDNVPIICKLLVNKGLKFKWYIIGFGGDEALIRSNIEKAGMQDVCILLGKRENPYPYMKACDFYILPSRFEGKAVTVREAQILCKPVIITNYATSGSQVKNGVDGVIVPQENEQTAEGIYTFVQDKALQDQIVNYLQTHDYGNENEVRKLEE